MPLRSFTRLALAATLLAAALPTSAATLLVGNKSGQSVYALDLASGEKQAEFATGIGPHEIAVSPNDGLAVVANYGAGSAGNTLTVIDLATREVARTIDLGTHTRPHGMRFLPDGRRVLVTTEGSDSLTEVDVIAGTVLRNVPVGDGKPHMVALSPDAALAYVTQLDAGAISVVDVEKGEKVADISTGAGPEGLAVAPDGEIWVGNRDADSVSVIDPATRDVRATLTSEGFPIRVVMTPDARHVLVVNARSATLAVFDRAKREQVASVVLAEDGKAYKSSLLGGSAIPIGVLVSADGKRVFAALSGGDEIAVIDTATWQVTARWATGREPDALAIVGDD